MNYFDDSNVNLGVLKERAFNYRWAEVDEGVIPLTAADPDYPCAPQIQNAIIDYVRGGYFSYTPKLGLDEFKEVFSATVRERTGEPVPPELVLPLDSAARAMYVIAKAFLKPGDEMVVFDPCDYLFRESCLAAGATPVSYQAELDMRHRTMDLSRLEDAITPRTRMIGLCNPHNPYGLTYTKEELDFIMRICEKYDLLIMNDEIWSDIIYPDACFKSIYCLGEDRCRRVLSVFGFSKTFGLAGLRIGCAYTTDPDKFELLVKHSDVMSTAGGAASISQVAAIAAMRDSYPWAEEFVRHLTENRNCAVDQLSHISRLHVYRPKATYLLYVDIRDLGMASADFAEYLKKEVNLAVIPGGHQFFGDMSEGYVRICIATSAAILHEGLNRLRVGIERLP